MYVYYLKVTPSARRNVVRVLSPATPSSGKSLISPRALMQQSKYNSYMNEQITLLTFAYLFSYK